MLTLAPTAYRLALPRPLQCQVLDDDDIAPVMEQMKEQLLSKNVASEVADELCKSVDSSLVGQRLERLTRVATVVRTAMQVRAACVVAGCSTHGARAHPHLAASCWGATAGLAGAYPHCQALD